MPINTEVLESQIMCWRYVGAISESELTEGVLGKAKQIKRSRGAGNCVLVLDLTQAADPSSIVGHVPDHLKSVVGAVKWALVVEPQDLVGRALLTTVIDSAAKLPWHDFRRVTVYESMDGAIERARSLRDEG